MLLLRKSMTSASRSSSARAFSVVSIRTAGARSKTLERRSRQGHHWQATSHQRCHQLFGRDTRILDHFPPKRSVLLHIIHECIGRRDVFVDLSSYSIQIVLRLWILHGGAYFFVEFPYDLGIDASRSRDTIVGCHTVTRKTAFRDGWDIGKRSRSVRRHYRERPDLSRLRLESGRRQSGELRPAWGSLSPRGILIPVSYLISFEAVKLDG